MSVPHREPSPDPVHIHCFESEKLLLGHVYRDLEVSVSQVQLAVMSLGAFAYQESVSDAWE